MNKIIKIALLCSIISIFTDANAMSCTKQCENAQKYKTCLLMCYLGLTQNRQEVLPPSNTSTNKPTNYSKSMSEEEARKEWYRRYPCPPHEESDSYHPYQGNYKKGLKDDDRRRAEHQDDDY